MLDTDAPMATERDRFSEISRMGPLAGILDFWIPNNVHHIPPPSYRLYSELESPKVLGLGVEMVPREGVSNATDSRTNSDRDYGGNRSRAAR